MREERVKAVYTIFGPYGFQEFKYHCGICKRKVKSFIIFECDICGIKTCGDCSTRGFCLFHYNKINPKGKQLIEQLYKEYLEDKQETKKKYHRILFFFGFLLMLSIGGFFINFYSIFNFFWIVPILIFIGILLKFYMDFPDKIKIIDDWYREKKLRLYKNFKNPVDAKSDEKNQIVQETKKFCLYCGILLKTNRYYCINCDCNQSIYCSNCGRLLRSDSLFCSKCGQLR